MDVKRMDVKRMAAVIALLAACISGYAQRIYPADRQYQADFSVYVVDAEYKADLVVFRTDREYRAKAGENKGVWFFTDKSYRSDKKIFFVDREYKALFLKKILRRGGEINRKDTGQSTNYKRM